MGSLAMPGVMRVKNSSGQKQRDGVAKVTRSAGGQIKQQGGDRGQGHGALGRLSSQWRAGCRENQMRPAPLRKK